VSNDVPHGPVGNLPEKDTLIERGDGAGECFNAALKMFQLAFNSHGWHFIVESLPATLGPGRLPRAV
jgi:hypothetical protein